MVLLLFNKISFIYFSVKNLKTSFHEEVFFGNIAPQVVFEILSSGNIMKEMFNKLLFYQKYGVQEYYIYNPDKNDLTGFIRHEDTLVTIEEINNWKSPLLGIRFELQQPELVIYHPNGDYFSSFNEEKRRADKLEAKLRELGINFDKI